MKNLRKFIQQANTIRFSLLWLVAVAAILFYPAPGKASQPLERTFRVEAGRFAYSPSILKVNQGDQVTLELLSNDVVHGLAIDGYDLEIVADPGRTSRLTFTANRKGTFRFRCSVTCGSMHPFMIGKIQVGDNLFWLRTAGLALLAVAVILMRRL